MQNKILISIVIPCYNSEKTIGTVVSRIISTIQTREEYEWEIILVNDGSKDNTWNTINSLATCNKKIKAINFSQNFGQHSAMMAGYRKAAGELIIGMDDDGENRPEEMFLLIDKLNEGYDCVCAEYQSHESGLRSLGTKLNNWMASYLLDKPKGLTLTSYYVVRRFVIDQVIQYKHSYPYIAGLFLQATKNWGTVSLVRSERLQGKSGYSLKKLLSLWVNGFTAFSIKPLRVAGGLGIFFAVVGVICGFILVIRKLCFGDIVLGYTSLMAALSFFGGMIMLLLGVIGEYVGRIFLGMSKNPQYVVRQVHHRDASDEEEKER